MDLWETVSTFATGVAPTLLYAFRERSLRKRVEAEKEQSEARAVENATASLKATVEQAAQLARDAIAAAAAARVEAKNASEAERRCAQRLESLRQEFTEFRTAVLGGPPGRSTRG